MVRPSIFYAWKIWFVFHERDILFFSANNGVADGVDVDVVENKEKNPEEKSGMFSVFIPLLSLD